jgi:hypothetical protein
MYVREIVVKKFRQIEGIRIGPFTMPAKSSDLVALAGPNGGGKSSVLELLGFALSNVWSLGYEQRRSFPENSFEVTLALTPDERMEVKKFLHRNPYDDVSAYFEEESIYYRSFNYPEGKYHQNRYTFDRVHSVVSQALGHLERSGLGFSLKSDRVYPPDGFQRQSLLDSPNMTEQQRNRRWAFSDSDNQYRDMFNFLVQQRYYYFRRLGAYHHKIVNAQNIFNSIPADPLRPYDDLLQQLFPGYRFSDGNEEVPSNLFVEISSGGVIPFPDLSSGEKEVFFILSFFLRHQVTNSIIIKEMFGFSGYIGMAKKMVFLEGDNSSADRKVFSNVFAQYGGDIKFIPAQSSENQPKLNAAILHILESDLGWAQFYLLRDRDYFPQGIVEKYNEHKSGRIYVLKRHEIENYLLDEELIAKVQTELFEKITDAARVGNRLKQIARKMSGEVLRDMISFRLNLIYRPEDFSLGQILLGQSIMDELGDSLVERIDALKNSLSTKVFEVNTRLQKATAPSALDELVNQCQQQVISAINGEGNSWKHLFPGKEVLEEYVKSEDLGDFIVFRNTLIKEMAVSPYFVPQELKDIVQQIADGNPLST